MLFPVERKVRTLENFRRLLGELERTVDRISFSFVTSVKELQARIDALESEMRKQQAAQQDEKGRKH
jgi:uncharacterized small protein (DUF1192 family)